MSTRQLLRDDETFSLVRSTDRPGGGSRLIVASSASEPSAASLARLQRAYQLRTEIDPRWGTRPIAITVHEGRPALLLEDPGGVMLESLLGRLSLEELLSVAIAVTDAVRSLHEAGLVHRDLKPTNVLVDRVGGHAWLTGLCLAEPSGLLAPDPAMPLAGTLAYMAPEQTGRAGGVVDVRSDLYSLGVTLYQLATGALPFTAREPIEWVHSHVAQRPIPPQAHGFALPEQLQSILLKLLEKEPEDRYQTAAGLGFDLRRCLERLRSTGAVSAFSPAMRDTPSRLLRWPKFKGRARELAALSEAFERVQRQGTPEVVLVGGPSGMGKSALVEQFFRRLPASALTASGKLDELADDTPYRPLARAFGELVRWLLAKSTDELGPWTKSIALALGPNGAIVTRLVPELERLIGPQPELVELPAEDARNRVYATLRQFLRLFANRQRPLALFLDDLQWLDPATAELLEELLSEPELEGLLLIGATRSRLDASLSATLGRLPASGRVVTELWLSPLASEEITELVADSILAAPEEARALSQLVEHKTGGNPFFVHQFLAALVEEGLLRFDASARAFSWDLERIVAKGHTDNLSGLVLERLERLPAPTREALSTLACLGGEVTSSLLAELVGVPEPTLRGWLRTAVDAQVVTFGQGRYGFRHDRLQAAAYSLIDETARPSRHLALGRALAACPDDDRGFEAVKHLNRGVTLIADPAERIRLAELNLRTAQSSMLSAADSNALAQLELAQSLLPDDAWQSLPELSFELGLSRAECEFASGDRQQAEALLNELSTRSYDAVSLGRVVCAQQCLYLAEHQPERAVTVGLEFLSRFAPGFLGADEAAVQRQHQLLREALGERDVASLVELPRLESAVLRATLDVCASLVSPAYFFDQALFASLVLYMATLSLAHGNTDSSCLAYILLTLVLGPRFGEHALGLAFGQVAVQVLQTGLSRFAARVYLPMGAIVALRTLDPHAAAPYIESAFDAAKRSGDLIYAVYTRAFAVAGMLASGAHLEEIQRAAEAAIAYARSSRFPMAIEWMAVQLALVRGLRGDGVELGSLSYPGFDDEAYERSLGDSPHRFRYWVRRLQARYHAGDFEGARAAAHRAQSLAERSEMFPEEIELWLYGALAEAACPNPSLEIVARFEDQLRQWLAHSRPTFANKRALVAAERARIEGRDLDAERDYEQAIQLSREHRLVHEEALAHELCGRFYASRGIASVAEEKWRSARGCYAQWGALGKLRRLEQQSGLLQGGGEGASPSAGPPSFEQMELGVVVSALRAVSGSLDLSELIDRLMTIALQQAAAERAVLVLLDPEPRLRARAASEQGEIRVTQLDAPVTPVELAEPVLRFVLRSGESVLLDHGEVPLAFAEGGYLRRRGVRSLLCLPIVVRGAAIGALYLENSLTRQAFGRRHSSVLELIAAQAATSLQNARLYAEAREAKLRMTRAERLNRTGSFSWRPDRREYEWSEEMLSIFGVSEKPSLELLRERIHPEDQPLFERLVADVEALRDRLLELRLVMPDGGTKHVAVMVTRVPGAPPEYVGTVCDVTEAKRTDEALQRTQAALGDMTRIASLGEMAAAIAHEVNQPLSAIDLNASSCLRWLEQQPVNLEEARESARRIRRDATRAGAVVQRLRALFSKTAGARAAFDLNEAVAEVMALVRGRVRAAGVTFELRLGSELAPALGDRVQIQQVVMNLVMNAVEAMKDEGTERRELVLTTAPGESGRLRCEVQDSGKGVPAADQRRIFEPFTSTKPDGMGIGLSICSNIIDAHGGVLGVRNDGGRPGATFYFEVPAADATPPSA